MSDCIFCKIVAEEIPCYKLYEDNDVIAFLNIYPESNGHTLIIPKNHYKDFDDIDLETLNKILAGAKLLANKLVDKLNCDGFTLIQNNGAVQEIMHYHLHIKPYYKSKQETLSLDEITKTLNK